MTGYWYLGSPYSAYPGGMEAAYQLVCIEMARLIQRGIPVFSPIAHTHGVAVHGGLSLTDHDIWLPVDQPIADAAVGMISLMLPGWAESRGLRIEHRWFRDSGRPVVLMAPGSSLDGIETLLERALAEPLRDTEN